MSENSFKIVGGRELYGTIKVQISKNAVLPIMSASLLCAGTVCLKNCPNISDFHNMTQILKKMGVKVLKLGNHYIFNVKNATNANIDCELAKTMRSSVFLIGSTLAKFKTVVFVSAGGCKIGKRPIDLHIKAFKDLGVQIIETENKVIFDAATAHAGVVKLKIPSVGATENIVQFASLLKGKTTIINPAKEPEVVDLCNFLNSMGAKIKGAGTNKITIYGVNKLKSTQYQPISDRIITATIMSAVALCGGNVTLTNTNYKHNKNFIHKLRRIGCVIKIKNDIINVNSNKPLTSLKRIETGYFPKFPTDLQSFMVVLACLSRGSTIIKENIFENRFLIASELNKMGANIKQLNDRTVIVKGVNSLNSSNVEAKDLRGGASLVLAGLVASGETVVNGVELIDRGYDHLENMLASLGANIKRQ